MQKKIKNHTFETALILGIFLTALGISGAVFYIVCVRNNSGQFLEIKDTSSNRVYGKWSLEESSEFSIEFIHSVNQSPVKETFVIEGKSIRLLSVRFFSFGAGMQSDLDEGQQLTRDGDAMVISGYKTSFKELNYIVGTVSDHLLYINGDVYSLRELCGKNAHITLHSVRL